MIVLHRMTKLPVMTCVIVLVMLAPASRMVAVDEFLMVDVQIATGRCVDARGSTGLDANLCRKT